MSLASFIVDRVAARAQSWDFATAGQRGAHLGRLLYRLDRRHRDVALKNLTAAFPDRDHQWR